MSGKLSMGVPVIVIFASGSSGIAPGTLAAAAQNNNEPPKITNIIIPLVCFFTIEIS